MDPFLSDGPQQAISFLDSFDVSAQCYYVCHATYGIKTKLLVNKRTDKLF